MQTNEFRVVWEREGGKRKTRIFQTLAGAQHLVAIMGPEPWLALGLDPDKPFCCPGGREFECSCGGETVREHWLGRRGGENGIPPLRSLSIETRAVGPWESTPLTKAPR